MSITSAVCDSYRQEVMDGIHLAADVYMLALIKPGSVGTHGPGTTNYSDLGTDEASGAGYTPGGVVLTNRVVGIDSPGGPAWIDFDDVTLLAATIDAAGWLLYNATRAGKSLAVGSFGVTVSSTGGAFVVPLFKPIRSSIP